MALHAKEDRGTYINILSSDGTFRQTVTEGTPGAVRRDWETKDGAKGTKYELVYGSLDGVITGISFYDGDFGKNLILEMTDGDDKYVVSMATGMPFFEDFAKKLPNIDKTKPVSLAPYAFEDDKGKTRKGVTVTQDGKKLQNYYYDFSGKENINGFPVPQFKKDKKTGEHKPFSTEEWKIYFAQCRVFLIEQIEEHHLIVPKNDLDIAVEARAVTSKYFDKEDVDVRFDAIGQPDDVPSVDVGDEKPF
jgi:hypothetical protein